ncbi:MAG: DUF2752 domain-containing protein [Ilumatobacteraceae bacterium]
MYPLVTAAALALGGAAVLAVDPQLRGVPRCPVEALTGRYCPGCGLTRACVHAVRGEFGAAIGSNALLPLLVVAAVTAWWAWLRWSIGSPWRWAPGRWIATRWPASITGLLVVVAAFTVARNLGGWGATLAP